MGNYIGACRYVVDLYIVQIMVTVIYGGACGVVVAECYYSAGACIVVEINCMGDMGGCWCIDCLDWHECCSLHDSYYKTVAVAGGVVGEFELQLV